MAKVVDQAQFHARVVKLLTEYRDAAVAKESAQGELERIFGVAWVDQYDSVLFEDRYVCKGCDKDFSERLIDADDLCPSCSVRRDLQP